MNTIDVWQLISGSSRLSGEGRLDFQKKVF